MASKAARLLDGRRALVAAARADLDDLHLALGATGDVADRVGDLADRAPGLNRGGGHLLRGGGQQLGARADPADHRAERVQRLVVGLDRGGGIRDHLVDHAGDVPDLVGARRADGLRDSLDAPGEVAARDRAQALAQRGGVLGAQRAESLADPLHDAVDLRRDERREAEAEDGGDAERDEDQRAAGAERRGDVGGRRLRVCGSLASTRTDTVGP
jgi:hypothetical protein